MGDLQRSEHAGDALRREVWPPQAQRRRSSSMLGLLAAALLMAIGIDTALWHQNLQRREMERRATASEERVSAVTRQVEALRDELAASQQHVRILHDELDQRSRAAERLRACPAIPEVVR